MIEKNEIEKMIAVAKESRDNAFVHRSNHKIGACILTSDGELFGGCNTESVISGLGVCAEMSAIDHAVVHGKYEFSAMAVVDEEKTYPCGSCLQYLSLFGQITQKPINIIVSDLKGKYEVKTISELLPHKYETENNLDTIRSYRNKK